jgi:cardiolipin synthase A/B
MIQRCIMTKTWEHIQIFHNGDEFFAELISSIRRAEETITLEFYIFEIDAFTDILLTELQLAVLRGCEVRLLVDGVGSLFYLDALQKRCVREGVHFRTYHPLPNFLQWVARLPEVLFSKTPGLLRRANRRNHRKTVVIDAKIALLGSFNMTRVHFPKLSGANAWRDSAVKVQGEAVESLVAAFDVAWVFAQKTPLAPAHMNFLRSKIMTVLRGHELLRLNVNDKIRRHLYKDLCRRILNAKSRVYVVTAYFLPKRAVLRALAKAAKRGVDVKVIIPGPSDVPLVKWAAYELPYKLQKEGVMLYEYQKRVLHAKYMVIDDWSTIGSFNLNHRSILHDLEVEAVLTDAESLSNITHQFTKDLQASAQLEAKSYEKTSLWFHWLAKTLFKLRYWF